MHNIIQYFESQINEWIKLNGEYNETNKLYFMKESQTVMKNGSVNVNLQILTTTRSGLDQLAIELANYEYVEPDVPTVTWPKFAVKQEVNNAST